MSAEPRDDRMRACRPRKQASPLSRRFGQGTRGEQLRTASPAGSDISSSPRCTPLGFDWRIGIGILGAFAAREVFVSTMGIVFDIGNADEQTSRCATPCDTPHAPTERVLMTPLTGIALMVFFVLACQCMSTLAVVHRESGSWRWPALMFGYRRAGVRVHARRVPGRPPARILLIALTFDRGAMDWQDYVVFLIVGGAVWFLVRRVTSRRRCPQEAG